jgi:hypothetical protein
MVGAGYDIPGERDPSERIDVSLLTQLGVGHKPPNWDFDFAIGSRLKKLFDQSRDLRAKVFLST